MVFNDQQWTDSFFSEVAIHEFGHMYGLGDMYSQFPTIYDCGTYESPDPVMCDIGPNLQWGDRDGIRWLYPKLVDNQNKFLLSGTVSGSDSAVALIDGNSLKDVLFVWGDYSSGTGQTTIKAKAIWDISSSTGLGGTVGSAVTLTTISGQTFDLGATLGDVAGDTSKRDLVISFGIPSGGNSVIQYRTLKDITRSGNIFTFQTPVGQAVSQTNGLRGTDVILLDMNNGGAKEMLVFGTGTDLKLYYMFGVILTDGQVAFWSSASGSGTTQMTSEDIGVQVPYTTERIVTVIDQAQGSLRVKEALIHFAPLGAIVGKITGKNALGRNMDAIPTGIGAGDSINLGEQSYNEQFFSWSDSTHGYYFIDWDSRLNSHR